MPVFEIINLINVIPTLFGGFVLKNLSWLIIPSFALTVSVFADTPVNNDNKAIKASYDFNLNVEELDQAEARLKALESSLSGQIKSKTPIGTAKTEVVQKKQLAVMKPTTTVKPVEQKTLKPLEKKQEITVKSVVAKTNTETPKNKTTENNSIADKVKSDITNLEQTIAKKNEELLKKDQEIAQIRSEFAKELEAMKISLTNQSESQIKTLSEQVKGQGDEISQLKVANQGYQTIEAELNQKFESQSEKLNLQLLLAETEVERLSTILEDQNRKVLGLKPMDRESKKEAPAVNKIADDAEAEQNSDMPVVKVAVDKANLRTGPGMNHSPLMELAGGSRLVVEQKQGAWFRVIAPNGVRAWISADVTETVPNGFNEETSTVKVQGYDHDVEARALKLIKGNS